MRPPGDGTAILMSPRPRFHSFVQCLRHRQTPSAAPGGWPILWKCLILKEFDQIGVGPKLGDGRGSEGRPTDQEFGPS